MVGGPTNAGYIQKHAACGCLTAVHVTSMHHPSLSVASEPHHKLQAVREGRYGKGTNTAHMHINKKTCCTAQHVTVSQLCMLHSTPRITQPRSICATPTQTAGGGVDGRGGQGREAPYSTHPQYPNMLYSAACGCLIAVYVTSHAAPIPSHLCYTSTNCRWWRRKGVCNPHTTHTPTSFRSGATAGVLQPINRFFTHTAHTLCSNPVFAAGVLVPLSGWLQTSLCLDNCPSKHTGQVPLPACGGSSSSSSSSSSSAAPAVRLLQQWLEECCSNGSHNAAAAALRASSIFVSSSCSFSFRVRAARHSRSVIIITR